MLFLGGAVVVAHGALGEGHMGDGATMCLAVMAAGGVALLGLTRARAALLRAPLHRLTPALGSVPVVSPSPVHPSPRAGPALLQVCLW
jgi:hypothetical protein